MKEEKNDDAPKFNQKLEKLSIELAENMERNEKMASLFSASTKKSGEDLLGETLPKKMSGSIQSFDESIPRNSSFQNIFQNTPYKSNFKKISPRNSPLQMPQAEEEIKLELEKSTKTQEKKRRFPENRKKMKTRKFFKNVINFI